MRWQDLKGALDARDNGQVFVVMRDGKGFDPMEQVARRVLALWQLCDQCGGQGQRGRHPDEVPCFRCGGTGITASDTAQGLAKDEFLNAQVVWFLRVTLPAFLFGEGDR